MITYLVCDLEKKKQQIGSTTSLETGRPYVHFTDACPNPVLRNATRKRPQSFFVFISEDDGLETREHEQHYLDFYFDSPWCYNLSPHAEGGWKHVDNRGKVWANNGTEDRLFRPEEVPEEWRAGRLSKPTFTEERRQFYSERMAGDNNPAKRPEVRAKLKAAVNKKGVNNPRFGATVEQTTRDKIAEGNKRSKDCTCPHCGKTMKAGNYTRWHGDNCKMKKD